MSKIGKIDFLVKQFVIFSIASPLQRLIGGMEAFYPQNICEKMSYLKYLRSRMLQPAASQTARVTVIQS